MTAFPDVTLQTARLHLRPLARTDVDAVYAMRSDPVLQRYGSHPAWTDPQLAVDYVERNIEAMDAGTYAQFAVVRRADAAVIGTVMLHALDLPCRRAEVGYVLLVSAWGHGYANEAVAALLDWGFEHLNLNRVEADVDPRNASSARVLERLGFVREGHLRERWIVGGEVSDSWLYGLLAAEWKCREAPIQEAP